MGASVGTAFAFRPFGYPEDQLERLRRHENTALPADLDYGAVDGLSNEVKQKLSEARPATLARASRDMNNLDLT